MSRLVHFWVYGGFLSGILLLILLPELARSWSTALLGVFLQLPIYMLHQFEEHDDDRFRRFVNRNIGGGYDVLPSLAVFVINVPGVWGVNALAFYLAACGLVGFGLIGIYMTLVNGVTHILASIRSRAYNPGLITSVFLFLPAGIFGLVAVQRTGDAGWGCHVLGLLSSLAIHAAIIGYVFARKSALRRV